MPSIPRAGTHMSRVEYNTSVIDSLEWRVAPETIKSVETLNSPEKIRTESIFAYYNPQSEVEKLQEILNRSDKPHGEILHQMRHYYSENIIHFLNEYAGKVAHSEISFLLNNSELQYADLNMIDEMKKTAEMTPPGSRERADLVGMEKIRQGLHEYTSRTNRTDALAVKLSPAYVGNYSFLLAFRPYQLADGTYEVKERIVRFPEKKDSVAVSKKLYEHLTGRCDFKHATQFLENPLIYEGIDPETNIDALMMSLGVDEDKVFQSRQFETQIRNELTPWIERYCDVIAQTAQYPVGSAKFLEGINGLKIRLSGIYNRAEDIQRILSSGKDEYLTSTPHEYSDDVDRLIYAAYAARIATVKGGGSCPVTGAQQDGMAGSAGYWNVSDIYQMISSWSIDPYYHQEAMNTCKCGRSSLDNHYHCDGWVEIKEDYCGEFYKDESHKSREDRTPFCRECGKIFNC